jgi:hypothetical protein
MKEGKIVELLLEYNEILEELRRNGVIKSGKLVADYGEYVAAKRLGLKLEQNSSHKGWDATKGNVKYEIKSRKATAKHPHPTRFAINWKTLKADYLVLVQFGINWELEEFVRLKYEEAKKIHSKYKDSSLFMSNEVKQFSVLSKSDSK